MRYPEYTYEEIRNILSKHPAGITVADIVKELGEHPADYERLGHFKKILKRLYLMEKYREVSKQYSYNIHNMPIVTWRLNQ